LRSQKVSKIRKSDISDDYKVYISEIKIEGDFTSFEEAMRGVHPSKWQEAKKDEIKLKNDQRCLGLKRNF
jgi:hypothetical protein